MMQNIASQILSEQTPSESQAPVTPAPGNSEQTQDPNSQTNDFDGRLGILTKMERKIKEREAMYKQKELEWEERSKKFSELEEFTKLFDENPLEAMKRRKNWGIQEINEFAVQHGTDDDLDPVAKITKSFTSKMEDLEKSWEKKLSDAIKAKEEEINNKDNERQQMEFKSNLKAFLAENKDTYEFIHTEEGGMDAVFDLIVQDVYRQKESGIEDSELRVMDFKTAAEKVESFLDKQYSKYLGLKKVQSKLVPEETRGLDAIIKKQSVPQTLDSSFSPKSKSASELNAQERKQTAIDMVRSWKQSS